MNLPIPQCVDALVLSCLEKDPDNRPQDATEILNLIDDCHVAGAWSSERAQAWWLARLPDLTRTLTLEKDDYDVEFGDTVTAKRETRL